jgi:hypothetical protein
MSGNTLKRVKCEDRQGDRRIRFFFSSSLSEAISLLFLQCESLHLLCDLPGLCMPVGELPLTVLKTLSGAFLETCSFHSSLLLVIHSPVSWTVHCCLTSWGLIQSNLVSAIIFPDVFISVVSIICVALEVSGLIPSAYQYEPNGTSVHYYFWLLSWGFILAYRVL